MILSPTRELATQTHFVLTELGRHKKGLHCHCFIGGLSYNSDVAKLSPCNVVVGTPGRIIQLINDGFLLTSTLQMFILDEADKMLQDGALKLTTLEIMKSLPASVQHICVSATYTTEMMVNLDALISQPEKLMLAPGNPTLEGVKQYYLLAGEADSSSLAKLHTWKTNQLIRILRSLSFHQCIVFSNAATRSSLLVEKLNANGWPSTSLSGTLSQTERNKAMEDFRDFKIRVLVSSDLVARGLDIDRINLVINMDLPYDAETYLHRVGRTGRFGTLGVALNIIGRGDLPTLTSYLAAYASNLSELPDEIPSDLYDYELNEKDRKAKEKLVENGAQTMKTKQKVASTPAKGKRGSIRISKMAETEEEEAEDRNLNRAKTTHSRAIKRASTSSDPENRNHRMATRDFNDLEWEEVEVNADEEKVSESHLDATSNAPEPPPGPESFHPSFNYIQYIAEYYIPYIQGFYAS